MVSDNLQARQAWGYITGETGLRLDSSSRYYLLACSLPLTMRFPHRGDFFVFVCGNPADQCVRLGQVGRRLRLIVAD